MEHVDGEKQLHEFMPWLVIVAICVLGALSPAVARAGENRPPESFSPLTGSGSGITLTQPNGIALDETTGNVFVPHSGTRVAILGSEGGAPVELSSPFEPVGATFADVSGSLAQTDRVAFDNASASPSMNTLYILAENNLIQKFRRNGLTEHYDSPETIPYPGNLNSAGVTVDNAGDLFVSSFPTQQIYKFDPAGNLVQTYTGFPAPPNRIAVDSVGDLFFRAAGSDAIYKCPAVAGEINPTTCIKFSEPQGATDVAVDPTRDTLYVAAGGRVIQYDALSLAIDFEFGAGLLTRGGPGEAEPIKSIAVNAATNRVYVADEGNNSVAVFAPPVKVPSATTVAASGITGTKATLNGRVNPEGVEVTECKFEYGPTEAYGSMVPCEQNIPTDSSNHDVSATISGLNSDGATYHFRLVVRSTNGEANPQGQDRTFGTGGTALTEAASDITENSATLNGIVRPEGRSIIACEFEYGTALDYGHSVPCSSLPPEDFEAHAVSAALTGLQPNTTYHFRLVSKTSAGTVRGADRSFTTLGPPEIIEQRPFNVTRTSASLEAVIDPNGSPTTYHFEFGTDPSVLGTRIPADHELSAGSGSGPVNEYASVGGLQERSVYYFRVVALNSKGVTAGPPQRVETLNQFNLPDNRAPELITPADKGPSGSVSAVFGGQEISQASVDGNSFIYPFANGVPGSTSGGPLRELAQRSGSGWVSRQISAPALIPPPRKGGIDFVIPSEVRSNSPDNSCGFIETYNPLTADTPKLDVELGVTNLYRWNADGSYDLVTNRVPFNPDANSFEIGLYERVESSDDCSRVFFRSDYELIPGSSGLYEWDEGVLRDAGVLKPEAGGPIGTAKLLSAHTGGIPAYAVLGGQTDHVASTSRWNAVSPDGERMFFTAVPGEGPSSGTPAIFMRTDGGAEVAEISTSETAVPTNGARFEAASADGSHVFFRANYGIDAQASSAGPSNEPCGPLFTETDPEGNPKLEQKPCDLYVYDVASGDLTDLSASADTPGAEVQGTVAISDDGSRVYFAALGQLVPGKGRTYEENIAGNGSANIYLAREGKPLAYVTTLAEHGKTPAGVQTGDLLGPASAALMHRANDWDAATSADGEELVFGSSLALTGWDSGGIDKYAAYVYDARSGHLACVSCRPDGLKSVALPATSLNAGGQSGWLLEGPDQSYLRRAISEDGKRVFFSSPDVLATGAVSGKRNLYQWEQGQVSLLGVAEPGGFKGLQGYQGASASGNDAFFATNEKLVPQDLDSLSDIYDVRVDGGFPPPPEPPPGCQIDESVPLQPNQIYCQGSPSAQPGPIAGGTAPSGGNVKSKSCSSAQVRRGARCLSKRQVAQRRCHGIKGKKAQARCVRKQLQKLNRTASKNRGAAK